MAKIRKTIWYIISHLIYKHQFNKIGKKSMIFKPMQLDDVSSISIEDNVFIAEGAWLMGNRYKKASISIGNATTIGHFVHLIGKHSITIEDNVLIADKVFISDCSHSYLDVKKPISEQDIIEIAAVVIGSGSWIGENVCICGSTIGKHCVIGANSVVLSDIPDYCVAVGSPAKVIKKYDFIRNEWIKI